MLNLILGILFIPIALMYVGRGMAGFAAFWGALVMFNLLVGINAIWGL